VSDEFLWNNFGAMRHPDTVNVSTNPYFSKLGLTGRVHAVVDLLGVYDGHLQTIHPVDVAEVAM